MTDEELDRIEQRLSRLKAGRIGAFLFANQEPDELALLREVKRLRALVDASPLTLEVRAIVEDKLGQMGRLMAPLAWTRETPTVDGVYWCRNPASQYQGERDGTIMEVSAEDSDGDPVWQFVHYFGVSASDKLAKFAHCEWAGPLVRP